MPSLRALILGMAFLTLALIQLSTATPVPPVCGCKNPTLPLSGEATELPPAPPTQALLYVALGRGVQNYTCANTTTAPIALGAKATLFDATYLAKADETILNDLPAFAVYMPLTDFQEPLSSMLTLGHHYFGADGTPTFDLAPEGKIMYGKKTGDIVAPSGANAGPAGTGAVDWLQLVAKPGSASVGLETVYRVVTAGGNPPALCPSVGLISVQYAAEYWFYGPPS